MSACGKYILNVGYKIAEAVKRANFQNSLVSPEQRHKIVAEETKLGFNKLEAELRKKLVEKKKEARLEKRARLTSALASKSKAQVRVQFINRLQSRI